MWISEIISGIISDYYIKKGTNPLLMRKIMQSVAFIIPALCLVILPFLTQKAFVLTVLYFALTFVGWTGSGSLTNILDVAPRNSQIVMGISNTIATIAGMIAVPLCGFLLELTKSWEAIFFISSAIYVIGTIIYITNAQIEPIDIFKEDA